MIEITLKFLMDIQEFLAVLIRLIAKLGNTEEFVTLHRLFLGIAEGASNLVKGIGAFFSGIF